MPVMVSCPPSSLGNIKKYMLRLTNAGVPYYKVETEITLVKAQNQEGTAYSELEFGMKGKISPEQISEIIAPYRVRFNETMKTAATKAPF
jgi:hypothetical protein